MTSERRIRGDFRALARAGAPSARAARHSRKHKRVAPRLPAGAAGAPHRSQGSTAELQRHWCTGPRQPKLRKQARHSNHSASLEAYFRCSGGKIAQQFVLDR